MSAFADAKRRLVETRAINLAELGARGWHSLDLAWVSESDFLRRLHEIAVELGYVVATRPGGTTCDALEPTSSAAARVRSLSKIYNVGEFPLHNDTAHWLIPCRYIVLGCVNPGRTSCATLLMDTKRIRLKSDQENLLHSTPLCVRNGRRSFFSTILSKDRPFIRYDKGCMTPTSSIGNSALDIFLRKNWPDQVEFICWKKGLVLVIDNWRVLHGRESVNTKGSERKLFRISIQ